MSFESIPSSQPEEEEIKIENGQKSEKTKKPGRFSSKLTALVGGIMAAASIASAGDANFEGRQDEIGNSTFDNSTQQTEAEKITDAEDKHGNIYEMLFEDGNYIWGVEYVSKPNLDHMMIRYTKTDKMGEKTTTVGEYETVFQAAQELEKMPDIPAKVKANAAHQASIVKTEQDFQKSGLVDTGPLSTENERDKLHTEERSFQGYGLDVKTTLEVDDKGKTVQILDSVDKNIGRLQ
jgi:hypothetical protein